MRLPKLKLSPSLLRLAYVLIDVEASGATAKPDARIVEYAFVVQKLAPMPPGKVLDVGCAARTNYLPAALASLGWQVTGIDIRHFELEYPNFSFVCGDMRGTDFPDKWFDAAYAVSSLEHFGLSGRYGTRVDDPDADAKSVKEIWRILRPGGKLIVTVPYGRREIVAPVTRVYDESALQTLLSGWQFGARAYWLIDGGHLRPCGAAEAAQVNCKPGKREAIALLELARPGEEREEDRSS